MFFVGGDFSFVFYDDFEESYNTSAHKYIIRKKGRGKKQSEKDKEKTIKSIGSQIRRENEKLLLEQIKSIIESNAQKIKNSDLVFIFAPGLNTNTLVSFFQDCSLPVNKMRSLPFDG